MQMQSRIGVSRKTQQELIILTGLALLALVSRSYGLSQWDLVADEYYTVYDAAERSTSLLNFAYYALVAGSFKLFGISEWSARLPAMLLGIITVPIFYLTWRDLFGRYPALVGALFIAFSSWHLWYSQFSRFYSGVFLFGSLSYFLYYQAIRRDSLPYLVLAMLANAAGFFFHATSAMVPASCGVFSIIVLLVRKAAECGYSRRIAITHLVIGGVTVLIAVPFLWQIAQGWHSSGQRWGYGPAALVLQIAKYVQLPIAVSTFFGLILLMQKDFFKAVFFALGIGIPVLALVMGSGVVSVRPDYMFYVLPLMFIIAAFLCGEAKVALSNYRVASHALTVIVIASMMPEMVSYYTGRKSLDVREPIAVVESAYQPGDRILSFVSGFEHYTENQYPMERRPGSAYDKSVPWNQVLQRYEHGRQRVWIILPARRQPLARGLEGWLLTNASLVWRRYAKRYDYTVEGYQIFLVNRVAD